MTFFMRQILPRRRDSNREELEYQKKKEKREEQKLSQNIYHENRNKRFLTVRGHDLNSIAIFLEARKKIK